MKFPGGGNVCLDRSLDMLDLTFFIRYAAIIWLSIVCAFGNFSYGNSSSQYSSLSFFPSNKAELILMLDSQGYYEAYTEETCRDINLWNTSLITDMSDLFLDKVMFNCDISDWDVSNVTDMSNMFNGAISFNHDIGNWDVSSVINMEQMFNSVVYFNHDIGDWDVFSF